MAQNAAGVAGMGGKELSKQESGDWLADIFDAVEDGVITSVKIGDDLALPEDAIAALEAGNGEVGKPSDAKKRGAAGEPTGLGVDAKHKKSRREKLRRDALNDRFSPLFDEDSNKWFVQALMANMEYEHFFGLMINEARMQRRQQPAAAEEAKSS